MLEFEAVRDGQIELAERADGLTRTDLCALTNELIDSLLSLIAGCVDADVTFKPIDPQADDPWAATPEEVSMPWTLGHVIVHTTASAEESAALAAELARGVAPHGRSRYEVPWTQMRTIAGCRQRLEESRRMRLAALDMWPDTPHLDADYPAWEAGPLVNAAGRYILGLIHEEGHLAQIADIVGQAREARRQF